MYYTNVFIEKNNVYLRGINIRGQQFKEVIKYKPYLFVSSTQPTKYSTIDEKSVAKMDFDSIWDAKDFCKQYENVDGFPIYGMTNFQYPFIFDKFPGQIKYDPSHISVVSLDIENKVGTEDMATSIINASNEITAITIGRNGRKDVFGCGDFMSEDFNITYHKCKDEADLLFKFLTVWRSDDYNPDVITGWNIEFYDIPYLVNRITRILGPEAANLLSPWGMIRPYEVTIKDKKVNSYELKGIANLDYLAIYKKFVPDPRESYRLDYIAEVELEENKIDWRTEGYTSLNDLLERNFQRYIEYNIHDVTLIERLEDKLRLIELVYAMAYDAKVNYVDTMGTVTQWDVIIHNYLLEQNIVVPQAKRKIFTDFGGGYVKDPIVGRHRWVVSCDLNSLYPHLIQQYNISPDTFVKRLSSFPTVDEILAGVEIPEPDYAVAANGCVYRKDKIGFLPALMAKMYMDRTVYKKQMIEAEKEYERTGNKALLKEVARLFALQWSKKIQLNSAYGALGNRWFRWFEINHAEAITISGQLSIQWIAKKINEFINKSCGTVGVDYIIASDTDSVVGNTKININGKDITIEEYFNSQTRFIKNDEFNENYIKLIDNIDFTNSIDDNGKLNKNKVTYVMKHKVKKRMFKIKIPNGEEITITNDHSIIVKHKKTGKISEIKPEKLNSKIHSLINIVTTDTNTKVTNEEIESK